MRSNIPSFRLPQTCSTRRSARSSRWVQISGSAAGRKHAQAARRGGYDAIFVGTGAPHGKELKLPGREDAAGNVHIGIAWLESVAFEHIKRSAARC
jgi:formate dehydrogenase beta subunit